MGPKRETCSPSLGIAGLRSRFYGTAQPRWMPGAPAASLGKAKSRRCCCGGRSGARPLYRWQRLCAQERRRRDPARAAGDYPSRLVHPDLLLSLPFIQLPPLLKLCVVRFLHRPLPGGGEPMGPCCGQAVDDDLPRPALLRNYG